ncbi:MAG: hypothetical protein RLZZ156_480 [Deinococcota bacterium]|jgi:PIN domain nuclease of toxin-antitoxin system
MSAVCDASAILAFFQGKAPELLPVFSSGDVVVSDVTIRNVEWALIQAGGKKLEIKADLAKLGLEVVEFNEKLLESTRAVSQEVSLASFEESVGAALAMHKKVTFHTAKFHWLGVSSLTTSIIGGTM